MKRIGETLKKLVISEATKLKFCATQTELSKLDFDNLSPESFERCIYGQMTGDCQSERASELLSCCAVPYSSDLDYLRRTSIKRFNVINRRKLLVFSAIEYYITCNDAKNRELIDFLRDKTQKLEL